MCRAPVLTCFAAATSIQVPISAEEVALAIESTVIKTRGQIYSSLHVNHGLITVPVRVGGTVQLTAASAGQLPSGLSIGL